MELDIKQNKEQNRFETYVESLLAEVTYLESENTKRLIINGTHVPKQLEGRGIAGALTRFALDYARDNGLSVEPVCPYTAAYIEKHTEYQDLLKERK